MQRNGEWTDFVGDFMSLTEGAMSPDIFRRWAAISLVAGALERRVWAVTSLGTCFPNLYVLLVGNPGIGKHIIENARQLWHDACQSGSKAPAFHVAPSSMTKASLIDRLAKAKTTKLTPKGPPLVYHSLLIAAEEFGVLLPDYDLEYIGTLNAIFNCDPVHEETRRHGPAQEIRIENPQINILGGAQPAWLYSVFPENAWSTGISRRLIMVYSNETPFREFSDMPIEHEVAAEFMLHRLTDISILYGQASWTKSAVVHFAKWHREGRPPKTTHSKLVHYEGSRTLLATKLAVVSAVSRTGMTVIDEIDTRRAIEWLTDAERVMPDIFREMIGKSDSQVIDDLHFFVTALWAKSKQKPVNGEMIWEWLRQRVPSDKIEKILMVAERSNVLQRVPNSLDLWTPRPRHERGVE